MNPFRAFLFLVAFVDSGFCDRVQRGAPCPDFEPRSAVHDVVSWCRRGGRCRRSRLTNPCSSTAVDGLQIGPPHPDEQFSHVSAANECWPCRETQDPLRQCYRAALAADAACSAPFSRQSVDPSKKKVITGVHAAAMLLSSARGRAGRGLLILLLSLLSTRGRSMQREHGMLYAVPRCHVRLTQSNLSARSALRVITWFVGTNSSYQGQQLSSRERSRTPWSTTVFSLKDKRPSLSWELHLNFHISRAHSSLHTPRCVDRR